MFPMTAEIIKGSHAYPKRIVILNKKTRTFQELGVWERLIELKVCEMHETQKKKILAMYQWPAWFTKTLFNVTLPHRCETSRDLRRAGCLLIKCTWSSWTTTTKLWLQRPQSTSYHHHDHESQKLCHKFALSWAPVAAVSTTPTSHGGTNLPLLGYKD